MKEHDEVEMEVFRTGDYGPKGAYAEDDLNRIAADYRPDLLEAPLTLDHAQSGPAYGWVSRLRREGDRLVAVLKDVPSAVTELIRKGAYKRRSIELFQKLPHTGRPYLRAVSLLGAATPEVKGLRDVCFASRQEACSLDFADEALHGNTKDTVSTSTPAGSQIMTFTSDGGNEPAGIGTAVQAQFAARVDKLFSDLRSDGFCLSESEAEALRDLGNLAGLQLTAPMASGISTAEQALSFAEGILDNSFAALDGILRRTLLRAPMGEAAGSKGNGNIRTLPRARTLAFSDGVTAGERVDPQSLSLHGAALQLLDGEPDLSYRDALLHVARGR